MYKYVYDRVCICIYSFFNRESIGHTQYQLTDKAVICLTLPPRSKGPLTSSAQMEETAFLMGKVNQGILGILGGSSHLVSRFSADPSRRQRGGGVTQETTDGRRHREDQLLPSGHRCASAMFGAKSKNRLRRKVWKLQTRLGSLLQLQSSCSQPSGENT